MVLSDVHVGLSLPNSYSCYLVKGTYQYYHYCCDGKNDTGWGCGYRTLQTLCSWKNNNFQSDTNHSVPSLSKIQQTLVTIGDKPSSFIESREWIGSFEICLFLDHCYNILSKIIHVRSGKEVQSKFDEFVAHFENFGSPVMIGGNSDAASKALLGVATDGTKRYYLILDPHFSADADIAYLQNNGWVAWRDEELFMAESFYNFCLPQCGQVDDSKCRYVSGNKFSRDCDVASGETSVGHNGIFLYPTSKFYMPRMYTKRLVMELFPDLVRMSNMELTVFQTEMDPHRRVSRPSTLASSLARRITPATPEKKKTANEPLHAALGKDLDETIATGSDGELTRNRALLHYMATLAVSNSDTDQFNYEFVQSLLDGGANINETVDVYGQTIFHEVARSWNLDVATFLLEHGADINQQDKYGRSPLHVCAAANHADMVEFLLRNDADIDSRSTGDGQTPLHLAAKNDAVLSLNALLGFGANIDSLDNIGRTPLQVAAESSRAATARILIEEGASSCVYDCNGSSAVTMLIEKMPSLALQALDQLHVSDTLRRRELYYLNLLEESRLKKKTKKARTPLETAVDGRQFDVLMHPVMQALIAMKWNQYGKFWIILDLVVNVVYSILFTIFAVETPSVGKELYTKSNAWRIFLGLVLIVINIYMIYLQARTTVNTQKKQKSWVQWRIQQLEDDLQFCHPRWQEEKYVKDEMKHIKGLPFFASVDGWIFFDWLIIASVLVAIGLNLAFFIDGSNSVKSAYIHVMSILVIFVWLRIFKYLRPFPGIGPLVVILGSVFGDFVNWGFFYLLLFIPFTACFWIIFGGNAPMEVASYAETLRLIYTMIRMSVGDDFDLKGLVAVDTFLARFLSALYITVMVIVCLNILIAYLSNTFQTVYDKAVENTTMQRASNLLTVEKFLTENRKKIYFWYVREHASPAVHHGLASAKTATRQQEICAEQVQKDFKKSYDILNGRFGRKIGKGNISSFDVVLRDVARLERLQKNMATDLNIIQSDLEKLGDLIFGRPSPQESVFKARLLPGEMPARSTSPKLSNDGKLNVTRRRSRFDSFNSMNNVDLKLGNVQESEEEDDSENENSEKTRKSFALGGVIPRISIFKTKDKSDKSPKEKGDDGDDDSVDGDGAGGDDAQNKVTKKQLGQEETAVTIDKPVQKAGPSRRPLVSETQDESNSQSSRQVQLSVEPSPPLSRLGEPPSGEAQLYSGELVPYQRNQGWNNDGFDADNEDILGD